MGYVFLCFSFSWVRLIYKYLNIIKRLPTFSFSTNNNSFPNGAFHVGTPPPISALRCRGGSWMHFNINKINVCCLLFIIQWWSSIAADSPGSCSQLNRFNLWQGLYQGVRSQTAINRRHTGRPLRRLPFHSRIQKISPSVSDGGSPTHGGSHQSITCLQIIFKELRH